MARLPTSLVRRGRRIDSLLVPLLRTCRDLASARNELRWLREHVERRTGTAPSALSRRESLGNKHRSVFEELRQLCIARGRGVPLQYLMGTTYFGDLELQCRPGVLIPREDTARQVEELVRRLRTALILDRGEDIPKHLRVLDLCTGSGCMALLFHHLARTQLGPESTQNVDAFGDKLVTRAAVLEKNHRLFPARSRAYAPRMVESLEILGVDIDPDAVALARINADNVLPADRRGDVEFVQADVICENYRDKQDKQGDIPGLMELLEAHKKTEWDIILANPPYISPKKFNSVTTAGSVRNFEPRSALVPPDLSQTTPTTRIANKGHKSDASVDMDPDATQADTFYQSLLDIAYEVDAKVILLEVGDMDQAERVLQMTRDFRIIPPGVSHYRLVPFATSPEIWCDNVAQVPDIYGQGRVHSGSRPRLCQSPAKVFGEGQARCLVINQGGGDFWIDDEPVWDLETDKMV